MMATVVNQDPTTYTNTAAGDFTLGAEYAYRNKVYRFVLNANAAGDNDLADGDLCYWASATTGYTVCNALNGVGSALSGNPPAGVAVRAIVKNSYGFIQIRGLHTNVCLLYT